MIILVGPSASGKTEVCKYLCNHFSYHKFVTTTTRDKRINEQNGVDYYFVTKEAFLEKIKDNDFIEYTQYANNFYGSEKKEIDDNSIIIVDPIGLKSFNSLNNERFISYFLDCDEKLREQRMILRGDSPIKIKERIACDKIKFDKEKIDTTYSIDSNNKTIEEICLFINKTYKEKLSELDQ